MLFLFSNQEAWSERRRVEVKQNFHLYVFTNDSRKLLRPSKVDSWNMTKGIYQRNFQFPLIIKITYFSLTFPSSAFEYPQHSHFFHFRWVVTAGTTFPPRALGGRPTGVWEGLTCDHSLSLCLCNPSFFSKKQTSKKIIIIMTPDLRLRRGL